MKKYFSPCDDYCIAGINMYGDDRNKKLIYCPQCNYYRLLKKEENEQKSLDK